MVQLSAGHEVGNTAIPATFVLGLIVAKVSGTSYGDFLQQTNFRAAGDEKTVPYVKTGIRVAHRAYGHTKEGGSSRLPIRAPTSGTQGDGGIYSNVQDLLRWDRALTNHSLLGKSEMAPAWTSAKKPDGTPYDWPKNTDRGSAVSVSNMDTAGSSIPTKGMYANYHDGESLGFRSTIQRYSGDNLTIIILSNRTDTSSR